MDAQNDMILDKKNSASTMDDVLGFVGCDFWGKGFWS